MKRVEEWLHEKNPPKCRGIVIFGERIEGHVLMGYFFEDGTGYERFFGTSINLSEW